MLYSLYLVTLILINIVRQMQLQVMAKSSYTDFFS